MAKSVSTSVCGAIVRTGGTAGPWRKVTDRIDNLLWSRIWMGMPGVVLDNVLHRVKAKVRHV